jgi:hypothetical protein
MIANHIHHALAQVQELQQKILEKQRFKGYSGRARAISGTLAFGMAGLMSSSYFPQDPTAHLAGWAALFVVAMVINFGAITYWFLFDPQCKRDFRRLRPVADVIPPLFVGGVLTAAMIQHGLYQYLFSIWMCTFGLANLATRHVLPKAIWTLGLFYVACGTICLFWNRLTFLNPWPMAIVFFLGEWAGGIILHFDGTENISLSEFLRIKENYHART